ncbi:MAG: serine hydrolase [Candidatus Omnitrophota bacterium]|jgi:beta-lactamase class A
MRTKRIILFIIIFIFLGAGLYFFRQQKLRFEAKKVAWEDLRRNIEREIARFSGETGIVVKDLSRRWEFSHNKSALFPAASLTKMPIMAACFLASEQGKIKLGDNIALKSKDKLTGSGILKGMPTGTDLSVQELIGLMIYDSDNTAANILTNLAGMDYLNNTFKSFGLKNTDLSRKIADYRSRNKGIENYTSAEDMALLLENMYRGTLCNKYVSDECLSVMKLTRTNDRIPRYLPANIVIAHKTGLENGVCHDAGIVFTERGDFIIIVLTKRVNSNSVLSKKFIARVALIAYNYFAQ